MSKEHQHSDGVDPDAPDLPDAFSAEGRLLVAGFDAQTDHEVAVESLCHLAITVLQGEAVTEGRVDLHFVDLETVTELNIEHMGAAGPTDVLSFPLDHDPFALPNDEAPMIGDIVVCPAVAIDQAAEHAGTPDAEFALLVIHGVLHLLGHDHAEVDETATMQSRERHYLSTLGFNHPVAHTEPRAADRSTER